jgi:Cu-processing system ATP-binding protein
VLQRAAAVRDAGGTVLITSHLMEEVESLADRVAYLEDGNLKFLLPVQEILSSTGSTRLSEALPRMLESNALSHVL